MYLDFDDLPRNKLEVNNKDIIDGFKRNHEKAESITFVVTPFMSIIPIQFHTYPFLNQPC